MKSEWVTENVKRVWLTMNGEGRISNVQSLEPDLQEALDLLHFAAKQAQAPANVRFRGITGDWTVTTYYPLPDGMGWTKDSSESLLHAVLLAIDAIVTSKLEAFQ